jgi:hypothetical protein
MRSSISEKLQQWELAGGKVRIARRSQTEAVVELCTCTGELMERFACSDQTMLEHLSSRDPSPLLTTRRTSADPSQRIVGELFGEHLHEHDGVVATLVSRAEHQG